MKDIDPDQAAPGRFSQDSPGKADTPFGGADDSLDLLQILNALWRRKVLVLASCALTAAIFFFIAAAQPQQFTATTTVMLDPREQRVVSSQNQVVSDLKLNSPIIESEVAIIKSATLLQAAITDVGVDRYNQIDPAFQSPGFLSQLMNRMGPFISASPKEPSSVSAEEQRISRIIHALRNGMQVQRVGDSYVIQISIRTPEPELSSATANALAQGYIRRQLQDRRRVAENATRWLSNQVAARELDLAQAEQAVETFKREQLALSSSSDALLEQRLAAVNIQLVEVVAAYTTEAARLAQITEFIDASGALAAADTQQSALILALRTRRTELLQQDLQLARTYGPNHPERLGIATELSRLEKEIRQEVHNVAQSIRNEISVLAIRQRALENEVADLQEDLADNASAMLSLRQLEREAEAAHDTYDELLSRLGETRAQTEIQRAEARMVNAAQVPLAPSSPRVKLLTAFGAALGLSIGMLAALSIELLSSGFINSAEVARSTGLAVLAIIPQEDVTTAAQVMAKVNGHAFSPFAERIRHLRTMLEMGGSRDSCRAIAVLSSNAEEGKTTTALALARSFGTMGKKTLILDLDTRNSALTHELTQANLRDLGDFLAGDANLDEVIYSDDTLGFSVAGSSKYTAILADSVSAGVLQDVVDQLREKFEVIVIDSPPLLAVSDGLQIASVSDDVLYLVEYRNTPKKAVLQGLSGLRHIGIQPTGIVLTKAETDHATPNYAAGSVVG